MVRKTTSTAFASNTKWFVIGAITLLLALLFFGPFLPIICFSAIMAFCFLKPYHWLAARMKKKWAATLSMILSVAVVVLITTLEAFVEYRDAPAVRRA